MLPLSRMDPWWFSVLGRRYWNHCSRNYGYLREYDIDTHFEKGDHAEEFFWQTHYPFDCDWYTTCHIFCHWRFHGKRHRIRTSILQNSVSVCITSRKSHIIVLEYFHGCCCGSWQTKSYLPSNVIQGKHFWSLFTFRILYFMYVIFLCSLKIQPSPRIFTYCVLMATTLNNLPRFFEFQLIFDEKGTDYWTSDINEDPRYITMSSYNELITTGFFPLLALCYYNYKIYARMKLSCNIDLGRYVGGKFLLKNIKMHQEGKSISFWVDF